MIALVGMARFELAASSSRTKRATGLRYIPFIFVWACKINFFLRLKKFFNQLFLEYKFVVKFKVLSTDDFLVCDLPDRSGRATGLRYIPFIFVWACKSRKGFFITTFSLPVFPELFL
jgi:hypothetical protein